MKNAVAWMLSYVGIGAACSLTVRTGRGDGTP